MPDCREFLADAARMTKNYIGTDQAFWFAMDFFEFRLINYRYGMKAGDKLLDTFEQYLNTIPGAVMSRRMYSDNFVVLVISEQAQTAGEAARAFREYMDPFMEIQQKKVPECTLAFCCGVCPVLSDRPDEDIDKAFGARREAGMSDSVNMAVYSPEFLQKKAAYRKSEQMLRQALEENSFLFYLQPKVDLATEKIVGAEALARLKDEKGNVMSPVSFLPIMEENGSVVELDLQIYRKVCKSIADRLAAGLSVVRISVNLSREHMKNQDTAEKLHAIAEEYKVPPHLLEFELTETIFLEDMSRIRHLVDQLRGYGYLVSIDDYGSGYTGFSVWHQLDFDILKLDACFQEEKDKVQGRNEILVPGLLEIADKMGVQVICEGVEYAKQCERLRRWGCRYVQGYYFSRPVPPEQFYEMYEGQMGHS